MNSSINPRTGEAFGDVFADTSAAEVDQVVARATAAAAQFAAGGRATRAALLRRIADALETRRDDVVAVADSETGIGQARLGGEFTRTVYQARLFAEVLDEGSYLEATIDRAGPTPMGPGPDLRRMLVPLGPVAVFGASNFPLAFSVPGGDTVSALAAGCPVVIKAHPSHPATSRLTFDIMNAVAPVGVLGIVYGQDAGARLVADARVEAVAFTGSLRGGRALMDIIGQRAAPIPFYGELSSLNPIVVTRTALTERGDELASGLRDSFTVAAGQLCTKPGLVFVPSGAEAEAFIAKLRDLVNQTPAPVGLNSGIAESYARLCGGVAGDDDVTVEAEGQPNPEPGFWMTPRLMSIPARQLSDEVTTECFGPSTIVVTYDSQTELDAALRQLPSSLTGTIHSGDGDAGTVAELTRTLSAKAGRVLYNGFPTGVLVSWAQTHGGPWPSTNTTHTSVGTSAIRRFLRPVTWQNAPEHVLAEELRDGAVDVPRREDGRLVLPKDYAGGK